MTQLVSVWLQEIKVYLVIGKELISTTLRFFEVFQAFCNVLPVELSSITEEYSTDDCNEHNEFVFESRHNVQSDVFPQDNLRVNSFIDGNGSKLDESLLFEELVEAAKFGNEYSLEPMDIISLQSSLPTFHGSESDVAIENCWVDLGFFLVESIVEKRYLGVMLPLLCLVKSSAHWIDLNLFSEVSNLFTFCEDVNHVLHRCLTVDSEINVGNLTLVFLDLFQFWDDLKLMLDNLLQVAC